MLMYTVYVIRMRIATYATAILAMRNRLYLAYHQHYSELQQRRQS